METAEIGVPKEPIGLDDPTETTRIDGLTETAGVDGLGDPLTGVMLDE